MNFIDSKFVREVSEITDNMYHQGWDERSGLYKKTLKVNIEAVVFFPKSVVIFFMHGVRHKRNWGCIHVMLMI